MRLKILSYIPLRLLLNNHLSARKTTPRTTLLGRRMPNMTKTRNSIRSQGSKLCLAGGSLCREIEVEIAVFDGREGWRVCCCEDGLGGGRGEDAVHGDDVF